MTTKEVIEALIDTAPYLALGAPQRLALVQQVARGEVSLELAKFRLRALYWLKTGICEDEL